MTDEPLECLHFILEEGVCIDCGNVIAQPAKIEFGDMVGLFRLVRKTLREYDDLVKQNTDPKNRELPRLRMVGSTLMRIPHYMFWNDVIVPSFFAARKLGFRGKIDRWGKLLKDEY